MNIVVSRCYICNAVVPDVDGVVSEQEYIPQSPGCWRLYTEVLAREYGEWNYPPTHRLTVDCYAAQHPTREHNVKSAQSVTVHLVGIYLAIEKKVELLEITPLMGRIVEKYKERFSWNYPPEDLGEVTIADVYAAKTLTEHNEMVLRWANCVWSVWSSKHDEIRNIVEDICGG